MLHPAMRVLVIWKRPPLKTLQYNRIHKRGLSGSTAHSADLQLYHAFEGDVSRLVRWGFGSKINGNFLTQRKLPADVSRSKIRRRRRRKVRPKLDCPMLDHGPIACDRAPA